jgi:hypothetical protein
MAYWQDFELWGCPAQQFVGTYDGTFRVNYGFS